MLKSTTLPAALLETAQLLGVAEAGLETPLNNLQISFDLEGNLASISASLPFTSSDTSVSAIGIAPTDYAPIADFDAGTLPALLLANGADITNPSAALVKIAAAVNAKELEKEAAGETIPDGAGVGLSADFDTQIIAVTASLPITVSIDNTGKAVITAIDYVA